MNNNSLLAIVLVLAVIGAIVYVGASDISIKVQDFLDVQIKGAGEK